MKSSGAIVLNVVLLTWGAAAVTSPCDVTDLACVRQYFARVSGCTPATERNTNYTVENLHVEAPFFNISSVKYIQTVTGLINSTVTKLLIDEDAGKTLLTAYHPYVTFTGWERLKLHQKGQPDIDVSSDFGIVNEETYTTTIWDGTDCINIDAGVTHTQIMKIPSWPTPDAYLVAYSTYPHAQDVFTQFGQRMDIVARETGVEFGRQVANGFRIGSICA